MTTSESIPDEVLKTDESEESYSFCKVTILDSSNQVCSASKKLARLRTDLGSVQTNFKFGRTPRQSSAELFGSAKKPCRTRRTFSLYKTHDFGGNLVDIDFFKV